MKPFPPRRLEHPFHDLLGSLSARSRCRNLRRLRLERDAEALASALVTLGLVVLLLFGLALQGCGGAAFESLPSPDPSPASTSDAAPDSAPPSALPDGAAEAALGADGGSAACLQDLSNVGTGDFRVDFTITMQVLPAAGWPGTVALVGQRTSPSGSMNCDPTAPHWEVILSSGGGVETGLGDGTHAAGVEAGNGVADGMPHRVSVVRRAGLLWYERDGVVGSAKVPAAYPLADLPPLSVGSNPCTNVPIAGLGTISDLCITTP